MMGGVKAMCSDKVLRFLKAKEPLFGGWRVERLLGAGASACVYEVIRNDRGPRMTSALKVIPVVEGLTHDLGKGKTLSRAMLQYTREVSTLYELSSHPHVVGLQNYHIHRIKSGGRDAAMILIMMALLPQTLTERLTAGLPAVDETKAILVDCLKGLEFVHQNGIIHRDVKPDNIFIERDGRARIGDFGIAASLMVPRKARHMAGTPMYMPPEVYHSAHDQGYSVQADLYSLGMVAYRMLHGHMPFDDETHDAVRSFQRRMDGETPALAVDMDPDLRTVLRRTLAFAPQDRFDSAAACRAAIERAGGRPLA
jgi:serine/threonine protein kinase